MTGGPVGKKPAPVPPADVDRGDGPALPAPGIRRVRAVVPDPCRPRDFSRPPGPPVKQAAEPETCLLNDDDAVPDVLKYDRATEQAGRCCDQLFSRRTVVNHPDEGVSDLSGGLDCGEVVVDDHFVNLPRKPGKPDLSSKNDQRESMLPRCIDDVAGNAVPGAPELNHEPHGTAGGAVCDEPLPLACTRRPADPGREQQFSTVEQPGRRRLFSNVDPTNTSSQMVLTSEDPGPSRDSLG